MARNMATDICAPRRHTPRSLANKSWILFARRCPVWRTENTYGRCKNYKPTPNRNAKLIS
jgi:hypothetical protein